MKNGAPSLRRRLALTIVGIVGVSLVACSLIIHAEFARTIWRNFDARLAQDAHAVVLMVEEYDDRPWEIEPGGFEAFERLRGPAALEVWMDDGAVLGREPPTAPDLPFPPGAPGPVFTGISLRDGRPGRLCQVWLQPRLGDEGPLPRIPSGRKVGVAVARDIEEPTQAIAGLRVLLWAPALGVIAIAALAALASSRGLTGHVARLSQRIAALNASSVGDRLHLGGVPRELRPPFEKLNELLTRIEASRTRERQFNADVGHELRTPLAGLRAILEVSTLRDRSSAAYRATLEQALAVVGQMEGTVESLLMLARLGSGQAPIAREEVALRPLVQACFEAFAEKVGRRGLRFENGVPPGLVVRSDEDKLRLVVANLLSNAAEYTAAGGWITVDSDPSRDELLTVRDSGPSIPEEALARLFDPFFRLDSARSGGGEHCGIGLTLVRTLCDALGYRIAVRNEARGAVAFTVSLAPGSSGSSEEASA